MPWGSPLVRIAVAFLLVMLLVSILPTATAATWSDTSVVSAESGSNTFYPSVAVGPDGTVHVVWYDSMEYSGSGGDQDIFYKSFNGSWSDLTVVSTGSTTDSRYPSIAVGSDGTVHVVWYDSMDYSGAGTDDDIFYKSFNGSWSDLTVVSTEGTVDSEKPAIAIANDGTVHVVWQDTTDYSGAGGDYDIFYKDLAIYRVYEVSTQTTQEGVAFSYVAQANREASSWSLQSNATFPISIDVAGNIIATPEEGDSGAYWVNISSISVNSESDWENFTLSVLPITEITSTPVEAGADNEEYLYQPTTNVFIPSDNWSLHTNASFLTINSSGTVSNSSVPVPGVYYVNVTARSAFDVSGHQNYNLTIADATHPVADAGDDQTVDEGTVVTFNGSASTDNIEVENYSWTFIYDSAPVTLYGESTAFQFDIPGVYQVNLEIRDEAGNNGTDSMVLNVNDVTAPTADAGDDQTVDKGCTVTFDGSGSHDAVGVTDYTWTFSYDGGTVTLFGVSPTYNFSIPGSYTVTLTVKDDGENTDTDAMTVVVNELWAPVITSSPPVTPDIGAFIAGQTFHYLTGVNETCNFTLQTDAGFLNISSNGNVTGTLEYGVYYVNISVVSVPGKLTAWQNFTISVVNGTWVNGTVNGPDDEPLAGAEIWIDGQPMNTTDGSGGFAILLIDGDYEMEIIKDGLVTQSIELQVAQQGELVIDPVSMPSEDGNQLPIALGVMIALIAVISLFYWFRVRS